MTGIVEVLGSNPRTQTGSPDRFFCVPKDVLGRLAAYNTKLSHRMS
jgi:hypothetical protein